MRSMRGIAPFIILGLLALFTAGARTSPARAGELPLETYNGGFFSVKIPRGWTVTTAGQCSSFAFLIHDPQNPLRQFFGLGEAGPVYLSPRQKQIDANAVRM